MLRVRMGMGGFLLTRDINAPEQPSSNDVQQPEITVSDPEKRAYASKELSDVEPSNDSHDVPSLRLLTQTDGTWMLDAVADLTRTENAPGSTLGRLLMIGSPAAAAATAPSGVRDPRQRPDVRKLFVEAVDPPRKPRIARPTSIAIPCSPVAALPRSETRQLSLQFTPISPTFSLGEAHAHPQEEWALDSAVGLVHKEVSGEQDSLQRYARAEEEMKKRRRKAGRRRRWDSEQAITITVDKKRRGSKKGGKAPKEESYTDGDAATAAYPFWTLMRAVYHTVPHKPIARQVALSVVAVSAWGSSTPIVGGILFSGIWGLSSDFLLAPPSSSHPPS
ncbi:hypothetical protein HGRIS_004305 [Hohenbuehelia grisea]|uniref:Uncharacterized protein n=1 Tax=Hohenbuehelia grisea TaxID=104357 RepID=A0ABR3IPD7_9AGAR